MNQKFDRNGGFKEEKVGLVEKLHRRLSLPHKRSRQGRRLSRSQSGYRYDRVEHPTYPDSEIHQYPVHPDNLHPHQAQNKERRHTHAMLSTTRARPSSDTRFLSTSSVGSSSFGSDQGKYCLGETEEEEDEIFRKNAKEEILKENGAKTETEDPTSFQCLQKEDRRRPSVTAYQVTKKDDPNRPSFSSLQTEDMRRPSVTAYQLEDNEHPDVKSIQRLVSEMNFSDP